MFDRDGIADLEMKIDTTDILDRVNEVQRLDGSHHRFPALSSVISNELGLINFPDAINQQVGQEIRFSYGGEVRDKHGRSEGSTAKTSA
jgi:hypothetical protein